MDLQSFFTIPLRKIEDDIYALSNLDYSTGGYDSISKFYNVVVGSRLYNKIMWGNRIEDYKKFAEKTVNENDGILIDAGCGSLNFTLDAYLKAKCKIILIDSSIEMLRICREKLKQSGKLNSSIFCVHGDINNLGLKPNSVNSILSMGMMHLFDDKQVGKILKNFSQHIIPGGKIFLSSLTPVSRFSKKYMKLLFTKGEVAKPRSQIEFNNLVSNSIQGNIEEYLIGSMLYQTIKVS